MTSRPAGHSPALSVVIPAYDSHSTLQACLESLELQTFADFETIVVDSGPDATSERIVSERFPRVRFLRRTSRLLPQAARRVGVGHATAPVIVFTDPDCYADREWLERLLARHRETGEVVVGALACHGGRLWDRAVHLCKFSKWLPRGAARPVDMAPTANLLIERDQLRAAGDLEVSDSLMGDVELSRNLLANGRTLWFEPAAIVAHHHEQTLTSFVRERFVRGRRYGELRAGWLDHRPLPLLRYLLATLLPLRMARVSALVARDAYRSAQLGAFVIGLPIVLGGHVLSLAGEAVAYFGALFPTTPP
ncbi:MAG TPA: glycosyltransferase family A protein [Thermoanaerobaculia bacterium]|nr:glycosyltransferase family A protein [Thermoanaerobaculia bacterium]